jgi:hypothetical protein
VIVGRQIAEAFDDAIEHAQGSIGALNLSHA